MRRANVELVLILQGPKSKPRDRDPPRATPGVLLRSENCQMFVRTYSGCTPAKRQRECLRNSRDQATVSVEPYLDCHTSGANARGGARKRIYIDTAPSCPLSDGKSAVCERNHTLLLLAFSPPKGEPPNEKSTTESRKPAPDECSPSGTRKRVGAAQRATARGKAGGPACPLALLGMKKKKEPKKKKKKHRSTGQGLLLSNFLLYPPTSKLQGKSSRWRLRAVFFVKGSKPQRV